MIKLDSRLSLLYNFVRENTRAADIGTDHGYLICKLLLDNKISHGYACDINKGPLENAKTTALQNNVKNISFVLCDGLSKLNQNCADDIIIAGMGGELIERIISECSWAFSKDKHFILQPMTKADTLRKFLCENGFFIKEEIATCDSNHFYTAMSVFYDGVKREYTDTFLQIGKLSNIHPESKEYIINRINVLKKRADAIKDKLPEEFKRINLTITEITNYVN
jgi:tRNA (adenine22-N1)-methyltransferase